MNNTKPDPNPGIARAAYVQVIGKTLLEEFQKKHFYTPQQVIDAHKKYEWPEPYTPIWAMAIFCSQSLFEVYTAEKSETYNYSSMRMELMIAMNVNEADLRKENKEGNSSWLTWEGVIGGIIEGIPDLFLGIFTP